ncbi:MAG: hypothetical protein JNL38_33105 [Myxococcales bacterium]|nr:hypothetical protein [Myxococcales bacterium]
MTLRRLALLALPVALILGGCASPDEGAGDEGGGDVTEDALTQTYSNQTLLWEGNWDFLVRCDSYSRGQSAVMFTCDEHPSRSFVDEGAWVAAPRNVFGRSLCNKTARVCKGDTCIDAKIIERSVTSNKWEGSTAVLDALGVDAGFTSCTRTWGTATGVKITVNR